MCFQNCTISVSNPKVENFLITQKLSLKNLYSFPKIDLKRCVRLCFSSATCLLPSRFCMSNAGCL